MADNQFTVEDRRRFPFTIITNAVLKPELLSNVIRNKYAFPIYAIICSKQNNTHFIPSGNWIAKSLKIDRGAVSRAFTHLVKCGLITIKKRKGYKSNVILLDIDTPVETKATEEDVLDYVSKRFGHMTPASKYKIQQYMLGNEDSIIDSPILLKMKDLLEKDKGLFRLVK